MGRKWLRRLSHTWPSKLFLIQKSLFEIVSVMCFLKLATIFSAGFHILGYEINRNEIPSCQSVGKKTKFTKVFTTGVTNPGSSCFPYLLQQFRKRSEKSTPPKKTSKGEHLSL